MMVRSSIYYLFTIHLLKNLVESKLTFDKTLFTFICVTLLVVPK